MIRKDKNLNYTRSFTHSDLGCSDWTFGHCMHFVDFFFYRKAVNETVFKKNNRIRAEFLKCLSFLF